MGSLGRDRLSSNLQSESTECSSREIEESLQQIFDSLNSIPPEEMKNLSEACNCIQNSSASSGRGLSTGEKVDFYLTKQFLPTHVGDDFQEFHEDESDFKLLNHPISFKTLRDGGDLAMCWSRNDGTDSKKKSKTCNHWQVPVMIYVRQSGKWWSNGPMKHWNSDVKIEQNNKKWWCDEIGSGFYLISQESGLNIHFKTNNKSTCILDKQEVYKLIKDAKEYGLFIEMPEPKGEFTSMKFVFFDDDGKEYC